MDEKKADRFRPLEKRFFDIYLTVELPRPV